MRIKQANARYEDTALREYSKHLNRNDAMLFTTYLYCTRKKNTFLLLNSEKTIIFAPVF